MQTIKKRITPGQRFQLAKNTFVNILIIKEGFLFRFLCTNLEKNGRNRKITYDTQGVKKLHFYMIIINESC